MEINHDLLLSCSYNPVLTILMCLRNKTLSKSVSFVVCFLLTISRECVPKFYPHHHCWSSRRLTLILYISLQQQCNLHLLTSKKRLEYHRPSFVVVSGQTPWWSMACHFKNQNLVSWVKMAMIAMGETMIGGTVPISQQPKISLKKVPPWKHVASIPWLSSPLGAASKYGPLFSSFLQWLCGWTIALHNVHVFPDVCKSWLVLWKRKHPNKPIQVIGKVQFRGV